MKPANDWQSQSLLILEKIEPVNPDELPTELLKRVYELIKVPLNTYTVEDLRLMIGQEVGLNYLIPLAIEQLKGDLFIGGDFYEGDLLANVLNINDQFWTQNPDLFTQIKQLVKYKRDEIISRKISLKKLDAVI